MDEYVLRAVLGSDEAEAFGTVEELDCSGNSHDENFSLCVKIAGQRGAHASPWQLRFWRKGTWPVMASV
jgi:hypothetical protein